MRIDGSCLVYADDTQIYVATQASDQATAMERLTNCIVKIRDWMASSRLKLNENKTQVIWLGTLSMSNHIAKLSRSCFFHLRQLRLIRQSLTLEAMNTLVQSFITNRLDSCNSVLIGVNSQLLLRMQVIQNAAARFITGNT